MRLSAEAHQYLKNLAIEFAKQDFDAGFNFDTGAWGGVHAELQAAGLIKLMGTRGAPWTWTPSGREWVRENRPDLA